jgi:catalase
VRPESFADHYSQARLFFRSMSEPEKRHIVSAFAFELGKVETMAIRTRMLGHLMIVDRDLGSKVEKALGMKGAATALTPARQPTDMTPSPALSMIKKAPATLKTRKIAVLVSDGVDAALIARLRQAVEEEGAELAVVASKIGGVRTRDGARLAADHALSAGPSIFFDAVALCLSPEGAQRLATEAGAIDWLRDAFGHLKIIGFITDAAPLFAGAGIDTKADDGVVALSDGKSVDAFIAAAKKQRIWAREPKLRTPR